MKLLNIILISAGFVFVSPGAFAGLPTGSSVKSKATCPHAAKLDRYAGTNPTKRAAWNKKSKAKKTKSTHL